MDQLQVTDRITHSMLALPAAVAPTFKTVPQYEVEGHDIPCNSKTVCTLCEKADQMTMDKAKVRQRQPTISITALRVVTL
jgi:hypothetical protein